jgi:ketosteroid isomerase-like protein
VIRSTLLTLTTIALSAGGISAQSTDEAEIKAVAMGQGETWTRHDAKGYAALFTEDSDVINVVGWWWKGRDQVERTS